jgi:hypothetical protein
MGIDSQLDKIYSTIDILLIQGKFEEVNRILEQNKNNKSIDLLLGYLTITFPAKSKLPFRPELLKRAEFIIELQQESSKELLRGLY